MPTITRVASLPSLDSRFPPGISVWRGGADGGFVELTGPMALEAYRAWLWDAMQSGDKLVLRALRSITEESVIGCTCPEEACVCEVILRAWRWLGEHSEPTP